MDYDKYFAEDIERKFFYTDYRGTKLVVGHISLEYAKARLSKEEYYVLVTYHEGEELPEVYRPLFDLQSDDDTLFATINEDKIHLHDICQKGGIQRISRLPDLAPGNPRYLLGPGPGEVSLGELISEQYDAYMAHYEPRGRK